jgi:hypothetical protein
MASVVYNNAKGLLGAGSLNWTSNTIRCALVAPGYTPDIDAHVYLSSVTNELSGTGYSRKDLAGKSVAVDNANDRCDHKADNVTWTAISASGATAAGVVVYKFGTVDSDSPLLAYIDITDTVMNGGDFTVRWDNQASNGAVFRIG